MAPSARAESTSAPLASCKPADRTHLPSFGSLRVTNPVRVAADGSATGQLGISVRSSVDASTGWVDLSIRLVGLDGRLYGSAQIGSRGCERVIVPLADVADPAPPLILSKNKAYLMFVNAIYSDEPLESHDPLVSAAQNILWFSSWQTTGFVTR